MVKEIGLQRLQRELTVCWNGRFWHSSVFSVLSVSLYYKYIESCFSDTIFGTGGNRGNRVWCCDGFLCSLCCLLFNVWRRQREETKGTRLVLKSSRVPFLCCRCCRQVGPPAG